MWKKFKRFVQISAGLFLTFIVLLGGCIFTLNSSIDLNSANKHRGRITSRGTFRKSFVFKLADVYQVFAVYRASRDYTDLTTNLSVGDSVTVYFPTPTGKSAEAYQIEKTGQVLLSKKLIENQRTFAGIFALVIGSGMLGFLIWDIIKNTIK